MKKLLLVVLVLICSFALLSADGHAEGEGAEHPIRFGAGLTNCLFGWMIPDTAAVLMEFPMNETVSTDILIYVGDLAELPELILLPGIGAGVNWYPLGGTDIFLLKGLNLGLRASLYGEPTMIFGDFEIDFYGSVLAQAGVRIPIGPVALDVKVGGGIAAALDDLEAYDYIFGGTTISLLL